VGVFIGLKSSGCPVLRVYIWYYYTTVQRLSRTSRYYLVGIPKSSLRPVLLGIHLHTICRVQLYYLQSVHLRGTTVFSHYKQQCTSGISTYVCTKKQERTLANLSVSLVQKFNSLIRPSGRS
jgi:hypothetical protein